MRTADKSSHATNLWSTSCRGWCRLKVAEYLLILDHEPCSNIDLIIRRLIKDDGLPVRHQQIKSPAQIFQLVMNNS